MKYGLFDTKENCWLGDEQGPLQYEDLMLARVASQVMDERITGSDLSMRIVWKELPTDEWKFRDTITPKYSGVEALARIERFAERTEEENKIREVSKKLDGVEHLPFWKEI